MKKNIQDLHKKSVKDLEKELEKARQEIAKISIESAVSPVKDTNTIAKKRRHLAMLLTVMNEKIDQETSKS